VCWSVLELLQCVAARFIVWHCTNHTSTCQIALLLQYVAVINVAVCCSYRQGTKCEHQKGQTCKIHGPELMSMIGCSDDVLYLSFTACLLQCVAVCCSVLQREAVCCTSVLLPTRCSVLQCIEVCCSVLKCVVPQLYGLLVTITSRMSHVTHIHKFHHTKWTSHVTSLVGFLGFRGLGV